jgi:hypothetical protein
VPGNAHFGSHEFIGQGIEVPMLTMILIAALALQSAPADAPARPISLDALPIEQAATARCAFAFATVSRWQKADDARGRAFPDIAAEGGREFFVQAMAGLMDAAALTRADVMALAAQEAEGHGQPGGTERIAAIMPACLMMKSAAGL